METQPTPPTDPSAPAWRHLIHTLLSLLPPPIRNTPEATVTRNRAAIARIVALSPVNANEAELAAQCVLSRAQAEDIMRLIRVHADDIKLVIKLNAQYAAMVRISLVANNRLVREQQQRRKREANPHDADQDEWTRHIAANAMLEALPDDPKPDPESQTVGNETPEREPSSPVIRIPPSWPVPPSPRPEFQRLSI